MSGLAATINLPINRKPSITHPLDLPMGIVIVIAAIAELFSNTAEQTEREPRQTGDPRAEMSDAVAQIAPLCQQASIKPKLAKAPLNPFACGNRWHGCLAVTNLRFKGVNPVRAIMLVAMRGVAGICQQR